MQKARQSVGKDTGGRGEQGYVLLMLVVIVALLVIALAVAAPKMKKAIQRDQEVELKHRGMEYARAVKLYYRKFNTYPVSIDQLANPTGPGNQRFLRKRYWDPITGKAQWRLVYFGQTGTGGNTNPNCSTSASAFGGSPGSSASQLGGAPAFSGSAVTSASGSISSGSSIFGGSGSSNCDSSSSSTDSSSSSGSSGNTQGGSAGDTSSSGWGSSSSSPSAFSSNNGGAFGSGGSSPSAFGGSSTSSGFGSSTFGQAPGAGGPIVGVASLSKKESIMTIKGKNHYNDLEFIYDPTQDYGGMGGMNGTGIAGSGGTTPGLTSGMPGSTNSGFQTNNNGLTNNGGTTNTTSPPTPTQ